jgi:hypothetical protein
MPFSTELDAFLAKVQARVDQTMSEVRADLTEMVTEAEKEMSEWQEKFRSGYCSDSAQPHAEPASQDETSKPESEHAEQM